MSKPEFSSLFLRHEGNYLASSYEQVPLLPPGLYKYDMESDGMEFAKEDVESSPIFLDFTQKKVFDRIVDFWNSREEYQRLKFPHKRGYLLYGPPGTGKTTLLRYLIQDHIAKKGICLRFGSPYEFPQAIKALRSINGFETPVLIYAEDIERFDEESLTLLLDGTGPMDNVVFVATTNRIDHVSDRLVNRPSRFDEKIEIGYPTDASRSNFVTSILPDLADEELKLLVGLSGRMSQAHLKELIIQKRIFRKTDEEIRLLADTFRQNCECHAGDGEVDED